MSDRKKNFIDASSLFCVEEEIPLKAQNCPEVARK
jgi:hypothetical protein